MGIKMPGLIGPLVEAALTPHPVDRYLELVDPMLTWRELRAKVISVERRTDRSVTLWLAPSRRWQGHKAGQFIQLSTIINGVRQTRSFSPANAADGPGGALELTITAHPDGLVSQHLHRHAHAGMVVGISEAMGEFTLPSPLPPSVVFISGGSGITPVLSMVRTLVADGLDGPITFVHYARSADDLPYADELGFLSNRGHVDLRLHLTRESGGHFSAEHLAGIEGLEDAEVFVCGPRGLLTAVTDYHEQARPNRQLHTEAFTAPDPIDLDPDEPVSGAITFSRSGRSVDNDGRSLLDQAEAAGLTPESGCRMGICFSCCTTKKSGTTRNVLTGDIDSETDTQIQLCINAPVGDVEIEV